MVRSTATTLRPIPTQLRRLSLSPSSRDAATPTRIGEEAPMMPGETIPGWGASARLRIVDLPCVAG
jgi:hypothetical protein